MVSYLVSKRNLERFDNFWCRKRTLTRLFIILVILTKTWFSEEMLISTRCIRDLMPNLLKQSLTVFTRDIFLNTFHSLHWPCQITHLWSAIAEKFYILFSFPSKVCSKKVSHVETTTKWKYGMWSQCLWKWRLCGNSLQIQLWCRLQTCRLAF